MKRIGKLLAVLFAAVILLGGCAMKAEYNVKVKSDKHVEMGIVMAYDKEMLDGLISMNDTSVDKENITDEMRWAYLDKEVKDDTDMEGATVSKYEQDGFYGYVFTKDAGLIDDLSTEDKDASRVDVNKGDLDKEKIFIKDGNKYKSNMFIDKKSEDFSSINTYKSYGATFQIFLTVELPNKPTSNNATEVTNDGKTLKYDLLEVDNIDFEFEFKEESPIEKIVGKSSNNTIIIVIVIAVIVVVIILALIIVIIAVIVAASKKKKAAVENK